MRAAGIPLGEYIRGQVYAGIKTGLNSTFWIDGSKRKELLAHAPEAARVIKPLVVGKNIRKWHVERQDKWLLYMSRGIEIEGLLPILDHLRPYREDLERRPTKQKWYELQQPQERYAVAYDQPKILFPDISKKPRFSLDVEGSYVDMTAFTLPANDLYLLGLLNSTVVENFFIEVGATVRGGYLRFKRQYVEQIPIPDAPAADREAIAGLAQKCLDAKGVGCEEWEAEIDGRVAALYGL